MTSDVGNWVGMSFEDGTVLSTFACPECDNDRKASLIWTGEDTVRCGECETEYHPIARLLALDQRFDDLSEEVPDEPQA